MPIARPVPLNVQAHAMYAVMSALPCEDAPDFEAPAADLLRRYGTSADDVERLASRPHARLVMDSAVASEASAMAARARTAAVALAQEVDGVVIDLAIPRVVDASVPVSLTHATQWYAVDYADVQAGLLHTIGLASLGLPEVTLRGVEPGLHAMYGAVLAGLAYRLIDEWPANDPVGDATVTLRDIAYGLGDPSASGTPADRALGVRIVYDVDTSRLHVECDGSPATTLFA